MDGPLLFLNTIVYCLTIGAVYGVIRVFQYYGKFSTRSSLEVPTSIDSTPRIRWKEIGGLVLAALLVTAVVSQFVSNHSGTVRLCNEEALQRLSDIGGPGMDSNREEGIALLKRECVLRAEQSREVLFLTTVIVLAVALGSGVRRGRNQHHVK